MAKKQAVALAGDGPRELPEGVVAPSEKRSAVPEEPFFELSRLLAVALVKQEGSGDIRLATRGQTRPDGPWEADWSPVDKTRNYDVMAAGLTQDGQAAIVAQSTSPKVSVFFIDEAAKGGGSKHPTWNKPFDLGRPEKGVTLRQFAMARNAGGRITIFGLDQGGNIFWIEQNPPKIVTRKVTVTPPGSDKPVTITVEETAPPDKPWSGWAHWPGGLTSLNAANLADGRIILFGLNPGHQVWTAHQVPSASGWSKWLRLDNSFSGGFVALAPALDRAGAVNLFGINQAGQVLQRRQSPPDSLSWGPWSSPGYIAAGVQAVATGIDGDGDVVVVVADTQKHLHSNFLRDAVQQVWSGWKIFGGGDHPVELALDYNADGRLMLFSHALPSKSTGLGGLSSVPQIAFDSTEWSIEWKTLAQRDIVAFAVVRDLTPPEKTGAGRRRK